MKNKGFTLAELLGVITLLAIVTLLVIPAVTKNVARGKQNLHKTQIENFKKAAADWMAIHALELPEGDINTSITLVCLKIERLLDTSIVDPFTGAEFPNDMVISIETESNQFVYKVDENSGTLDKEVPLPSNKCKFSNSAISE